MSGVYSDSRYANSTGFQSIDPRSGVLVQGMFRKWPVIRSNFYLYTWVEGDRIDVVSNILLGSPTFWWKIMDLNPEIIDPFDIRIGTTIRIPSV